MNRMFAIGFMFLVSLFSVQAATSTPTEWLIVTQTESSFNGTPIQFEQTGQSINCAGVNQDSPIAQDVAKLGPKGDCTQPLAITFDATVPTSCNGEEKWGPTLASSSLSNGSFNGITEGTDSIDSNDGGVTSITVACANQKYTIVVTNEDTSVFTFIVPASSDPMTNGTFTSTGGQSNNDHGTAIVWNNLVPPSDNYQGTFDVNLTYQGVSNGTTGVSSINFGTPILSSQFQYEQTITATRTSGNVCWLANSTLTSTDDLAKTYSPSYISGDFSVIYLGDGKGTVVNLVFQPSTTATESDLGIFGIDANPDSTSTVFVSYQVLASNVPGCASSMGFDLPFHRTGFKFPARPPIHRGRFSDTVGQHRIR